MKQSVLVIIKPDGMSRGLVGNVLNKFEQANLDIIGIKSVIASEERAKQHYEHLQDKPFFGELIEYLMGKLHATKSMVAIVYHGDDAIKTCRDIAGATHPELAEPLSIRGAYGRVNSKGLFENVVHVSSDQEEAEREIKLWFTPEELSVDVYPSELKSNLERVVWS